MNFFISTDKKLHHAYCIIGDRDASKKEVFEFLEKELGIIAKGSNNIRVLDFDSLYVDDAKAIRDAQSSRAFGGGKNCIIVSANRIQHEAQNALLKVFEEPTEDTHFFLLLPSRAGILPTVFSRFFVIEGEAGARTSFFDEANDFLSSSLPDRLTFAKKFATAVSEEKRPKADAVIFLDALEEIFYKKASEEKKLQEYTSIFKHLLEVKSFMRGNGSSVKMLLEYLAILLP